jgi:pimeloyl-ACP methyl ester carboxylesterase
MTILQSYGSVLGQYFSSMYPDKVKRVIIDGVYDAVNYRKTLWDSNLHDTEKVWASFFQFCTEGGPSKCPVAEKTAGETFRRVNNIIKNLEANPIAVPFDSGPLVLTSDILKSAIFTATYFPVVLYPLLAYSLAGIETNNLTGIVALASQSELYSGLYTCSCEAEIPWNAQSEGFYTVACADGDPISDSPEVFQAHYEKLVQMSPLGGPIWAQIRMRCGEWKLPAKWRHTDPFGGNTSHPLLLVQPTWDPVCPKSDALKVRARFPGAGFLEQRSYGHCSVSSSSLCTARAVREYFVNGTLPEEGKVCDVDILPILGEVNRDDQSLSAEDRELQEASKALIQIRLPRLGF